MSTESPFNVMDLHSEFSQTEHGQQLAAQVRYERYMPDGLTNERWIEVLGVDVNNLGHMQLTWGLTRDMIRHLRILQPGFLDEREELLLETAAIIHDRAEAVVGDISFGDKTNEHEEVEKAELAAMVQGSNPIVKQAAETIVFDAESKLGLVFNSVERIGYLRTALRAARHIRDKTAPDCEDGLRWLIADVFSNHPAELLARRDQHRPVATYLTNVAAEITQGFKHPGPLDFNNYPADKRQVKLDEFNNAHAAWLSSLEPTPSS